MTLDIVRLLYPADHHGIAINDIVGTDFQVVPASRSGRLALGPRKAKTLGNPRAF
jgi:hypothetical protein